MHADEGIRNASGLLRRCSWSCDSGRMLPAPFHALRGRSPSNGVYAINEINALYEFYAIKEIYAFYEINEFYAINAINAFYEFYALQSRAVVVVVGQFFDIRREWEDGRWESGA